MRKDILSNMLIEIDNYKSISGKSYKEIAEEIGINPYVFANMRCMWKKNKKFPRDETFKKLKKFINI